MSVYTTEVRYICETANNLSNSAGYNSVNEIIKNALPSIFNFNFPIFDEKYRSVLETKILKHFYTREIGEETVGLWKLRLDTRLNEIMPYYNKLYMSELLEFNPLYTSKLTRKKNTNFKSDKNTTNNGTVDNTGNVNSTAHNHVIDTSTDVYSDTPQGSLTNVLNMKYLTNARKVDDENTGDGTNKTDSKSKTITKEIGADKFESGEDYLENIIGYEGASASDLLLKYRETFLNIDMMIINDLEDLFMQLW